MTLRRVWNAGCLIACVMATCDAAEVRLIPSACRNVEITSSDGVWTVRTTGSDPFLIGEIIDAQPTDIVLQVDCFSVNDLRTMEVFLGPPLNRDSRCEIDNLRGRETWQTYRCEIDPRVIQNLSKRPQRIRWDLGRIANRTMQIRRIALMPRTANEVKEQALKVAMQQQLDAKARRVTAYINRDYPGKIRRWSVDTDRITMVGGGLPPSVDVSELRIVRWPIWQTIWNESEPQPVSADVEVSGTFWQARFDRFHSGRDALLDQFQVMAGDQPITGRQYVGSIPLAIEEADVPNVIPRNQKGLGGLSKEGPIDELVELGVTAVTLNMVLNPFLSHRPGPGYERIDAPGIADDQPLYFNPRAFASYDERLEWAKENDVVVSAILLISASSSSSNPALPLVHPDNDGGSYSMPNLTSARGVAAYTQVLRRIAQRYRRVDGPHGGITNWIAHNEVDQHKVWTNMGSQPRELVIDTYYRSMRLIDQITRQFNPHARTFASLTHHWSMPSETLNDRFAPKTMVERLQQYSVLEGDFPWGVAYHPYAQSLFATTAWNDSKVTSAFDTPYITIQNIGVLDRFLKQASMRDSSQQVRPVLLSEQGYHCDTDDDASQAKQAACIAYAMQQIRQYPNIESFHYHRWVDHHNEGGLRMGLRTLPSKSQPFGAKKRAWNVYQAIGTPQENEVLSKLTFPSP